MWCCHPDCPRRTPRIVWSTDAGRVVDVGRAAARTHQSLEHDAFIGLMCRLYLVMREHGFLIACGMMSARGGGLMSLFGLRLEVLGPEQPTGTSRGQIVRFGLMSATRLLDEAQDPLPPQEARTSALFAPPNPKELESE